VYFLCFLNLIFKINLENILISFFFTSKSSKKRFNYILNFFKKKIDDCEQLNPLGHLNESITEENLRIFEEWRNYDDSQDNFCEPDGLLN
jgi:hypothetical protein